LLSGCTEGGVQPSSLIKFDGMRVWRNAMFATEGGVEVRHVLHSTPRVNRLCPWFAIVPRIGIQSLQRFVAAHRLVFVVVRIFRAHLIRDLQRSDVTGPSSGEAYTRGFAAVTLRRGNPQLYLE